MFAWMNGEALARTLETRSAHFGRRRQALWRKGEESGNTLEVVELRTDCDQDAVWLRVRVAGRGVACHTGRRSCFYRAVQLGKPAAESGLGVSRDIDGAPIAEGLAHAAAQLETSARPSAFMSRKPSSPGARLSGILSSAATQLRHGDCRASDRFGMDGRESEMAAGKIGLALGGGAAGPYRRAQGACGRRHQAGRDRRHLDRRCRWRVLRGRSPRGPRGSPASSRGGACSATSTSTSPASS